MKLFILSSFLNAGQVKGPQDAGVASNCHNLCQEYQILKNSSIE